MAGNIKHQACVWKLLQLKNSIQIIHIDIPSSSLDEISQTLPDCAYTTFRTYNHNWAIKLENQYERLVDTCKLSDKPISINFKKIREGLRLVLSEKKDIPELRIRISIDIEKGIGDIYLSIEELTIPKSLDYQKGVNVVLQPMKRDNPKAKLTNFLKTINQLKNNIGKEIHEIIMVDEERQILEGLSSNIFIYKGDQIWTADEGALSGITRGTVLEIFKQIGIPVIYKGLPEKDLPEAKEIFITSTSRAVLPIKCVKDHWESDDVPGPITRKVMKEYNDLIIKILEKI